MNEAHEAHADADTLSLPGFIPFSFLAVVTLICAHRYNSSH